MFVWLIFGHLPSVGSFMVPCVTKNNNLVEVDECIKNDVIYREATILKIEQVGGICGEMESHVGQWVKDYEKL